VVAAVVCVNDLGRSVANVTVHLIYDDNFTQLQTDSGMIFKLQDII